VIIALSQSDLNTLGTVLVLVVVFIFGPRFYRAQTAKAREDDLKRTIEAQHDRITALEGIETQRVREVEQLREEVRQCHTAAAEWEARYHEQAKYTAKDALELVATELGASRAAMVAGFASQGELLLKVLEQDAALVAGLDQVGARLDRIEQHAA
jgi:cell division protein FtsB